VTGNNRSFSLTLLLTGAVLGMSDPWLFSYITRDWEPYDWRTGPALLTAIVIGSAALVMFSGGLVTYLED
jgi:hypothetical protein